MPPLARLARLGRVIAPDRIGHGDSDKLPASLGPWRYTLEGGVDLLAAQLAALIGELYLTNRVLSAQEALDRGLVNRVVPAADLMTEVTRLATQLAKGPTLADDGVKKLVMMSGNDTLESQMEREPRSIVAMSRTKDAREGFKAFVDKRKPNFVGESAPWPR